MSPDPRIYGVNAPLMRAYTVMFRFSLVDLDPVSVFFRAATYYTLDAAGELFGRF